MWTRPTSTILQYISPDITTNGNIAAFDLDWTLIRPGSSSKPKNSQDVYLLPNRYEVLEDLVTKGYTLVIISNETPSATNTIENIKERTGVFVSKLCLPVFILVSIASDNFAKPYPSMWKGVEAMVTKSGTNLKSAFYVGDSAGRKDNRGVFIDDGDLDAKFANSTGLTLYTPDEFFPPEHITLPKEKNVVLTVGMPGTQREQFALMLRDTMGYAFVSKFDEANRSKSGKRMAEEMVARMNEGRNVVVDGTNPSYKTTYLPSATGGTPRASYGRSEFYDRVVAGKYNITVVHFVTDGTIGNDTMKQPNQISQKEFTQYSNSYDPPSKMEVPGRYFQVDRIYSSFV